MMQITEDTPPDMLAGAMDLTVHLPNGRMMKMSVERSTPMMDLLVQITTAHQLQQSGHILQALEMAPSTSRTDKVLPYKPNTPIGALDTQHVKVVPKHKSSTIPKNASVGHQPFESTFRLQVHLPRNQLYVVRVSQYVLLEDIMKKVCDEKNLDMKKYEFRHPGNLDEVLDPKLTLSDYQITEVYIVSKGTVGLTQAFSSNDIMVLKKEEERKQLQARTGGGVFSLIFKRGKSSMGSGSLSSDNRSISPSHSDDSRSVTPPAIQQILPVTQHSSNVEKPKPPQRKRRPAPKPPQQANARKESSDNPPSQISTSSETNKSETQSKTENGLTICHSRNSSDSSGYHEPSVLSDNCNLSLPRRTKPNIITEALSEEMPTVDNNKNNGNLSKMAVFSKSNISITSRKKKAAPPPPPILNSERIVENPEKASPVVASPIIEVQGNSKPDETLNESDKCENKVVVVERVEELKTSNDSDVDIVDKSSSISVEVPATADPESDAKNSLSTAPSKESIGEILVSSKECTLSQSVSVNSFAKDSAIAFQSLTNSDNKYNTSKIIEADKVSAVPNAQEVELERDKQNFTEEFSELENEWQYHLPSPPTAFRDLTPTDLTDVTNYDTITIGGFKEESVITNPMLYQKLELIKDYRSETDTFSDMNSNLSEEERPMLNKLTLENLEKRKSLVYNRELSTSLKIAQDSDTSSLGDKKQDEVIHTHTSVIHELEEVIHSNGNKLLSRHNSYTNDLQSTYDNHLPNFKISTYNKPKSRINIFEDDSVRSNIENSTRSNSLSEQEDANVQITEAQDVETPTTEEKFKEPQEFSKYKVFSKNNFYVKHRSDTTNNVSRSESFSSNPNYNSRSWKPQNPVQRSKSQVALNNYKEDKSTGTDSGSLSKSNSLFDVSGLQSLEVMRIIQTKLNTPTNSTEQLLIPEETLEQDVKNSDNRTAEKSNENITTKMYKYQGPPAINLSTWSERPKTKVSLKEDTDYKINGTVSSGLPINNVSNNQETEKNCETHSVTVKINGTNHTTIQDTKTREHKFARFVNHALSTAYRKPLSNINKIESSGRPHSIAFPSEFDVSRLPIVRSVELKKPFKDNVQMNNKSITQINCSNNELANNFLNKYRNVEPSVEPVKEIKSSQYQNSKDNINIDVVKKPIQRVNSFAQSRIAPTVIGFRNIEIGNDNTPRSRKSWNVPNSYSTLPPKIKPEPPAKTNTYIPNNNVPFSQVTLRKVEVNNKSCRDDNQTSTNFEKVVLRNTSVGHKTTNYNRYSTGTSGLVIDDCLRRNSKDAQVPLPPPAPKVMNIMKKSLKTYQTVQDPRDDLLNSIRNFGGINGLRNINV